MSKQVSRNGSWGCSFRLCLPLAVMLLWSIAALLGPGLPLEPDRIDLSLILVGPGETGMLGSDDLGRPVLDRLLVGARTSFLVALGVVAVSLLLGSLIGGLAGLLGGWVDLLLVRLIDVFLAFPGILLAIALAGVMGPGVDNLVIALSVVGWVGYARLGSGGLYVDPRWNGCHIGGKVFSHRLYMRCHSWCLSN